MQLCGQSTLSMSYVELALVYINTEDAYFQFAITKSICA